MRITRFVRESSHTNPFQKYLTRNLRQFTFFKEYFTKLKVIRRTDGLTDKLIWGGLGNLRFLQVYGTIYLEEPCRLPSPPQINLSVRL